MGKPWFSPKRYGYGAGLPCSWEGWAVLAALFAVILVGRFVIASDATYAIVVLVAIIATIVAAAAKTKGGWRWRWGRD